MTLDPLEPEPAFQVRVLEGRALAEGGNYEAAEQHFRALLDEARGGHPGNHARALSSLTTLYGRAGRYLEAHLLGRRLAAMAREAAPGTEGTLAFAYGAICGALGQLHLAEPLEAALAEMWEVLQDSTSGRRRELQLEYYEAAAGHAAAVGDALRARQYLNEYRNLLESPESTATDHWVLHMFEAHVSLLEGQPEIARRHLSRLRARELTPPFHRLQELPLCVAVSAALGEQGEARRLASEAIAILESIQDEPFLASDRIHRGNLLSHELEKLGAPDLTQRVHDLVAAAVMIRLKQVDTCMAQLPELGLGDPESTDVLTGFRKQFIREQRALLRRVATLLESQGDDHVRALLQAAAPEGLIAVCAWCESVRPSEGRWLPIGHFVPREGQLQVTHSICPTCAERWGAA